MTKLQDKKIKKLEIALKETSSKLKIVESLDINVLKDLSKYTIKPNTSLSEECTAITQFGDLHADEIVSKNIVNGLNEYNPTICENRTEKYFSRLIYMLNTYRRGGIKIDNLVLHLTGDFISGWIHEELIETNSMTPIEGIMFVEKLLIKGIKTLSEEGNLTKIVIPCSCGNHARITKKNHHKNTNSTSYEWLMYNHLASYFKEHQYNNIEFILSESPFIYYEIYGKINLFTHGNLFNYQGGIGGIEVPLKKWIYRENNAIKFDMAWLGHWHTYLSLPKVRMSTSVKGHDEFARTHGFAPEPPQMQLQLLDSKRGYTFNCPILLKDY